MNKVKEFLKKRVQRTSHEKSSEGPKKNSKIHLSNECHGEDDSPRRSSFGTSSTLSMTSDSQCENHEESDTYNHHSSDFTFPNFTKQMNALKLERGKTHEERMKWFREFHEMSEAHRNSSQSK